MKGGLQGGCGNDFLPALSLDYLYDVTFEFIHLLVEERRHHVQ
jgi:hypothetical protein